MLRLPVFAVLLLLGVEGTPFKNCGTKNDRLVANSVSLSGKLVAGGKASLSAKGATNLHSVLTTGAWQVRVYETGLAHATSTSTGDLVQAVKFNDPSNPTSFTLDLTFDLPKKQASGKFTASITGTDQDKAEYFCIEVNYQYTGESGALFPMWMGLAAGEAVAAPQEMHYRLESAGPHLKVESCRDIPEGTYGDPVGSCEEHGYTHKCLSCHGDMEFFVQDAATCTQKSTECYFKGPGETCHGISVCPHTAAQAEDAATAMLRGVRAGCRTDADCPSSYCMNDKTKKAPYTCHGCGDSCCLTDKDCGSGSYCMHDHTKKPPYTCHGGAGTAIKFFDFFA